MNETDIAWLAGIYEGEGCLNYNASRDIWRIQIGMTDEDIIRRARDIAGGVGQVTVLNRDRYKTQWIWTINSADDIAHVVTSILPWLGIRRASKAAEFLAWLDNCNPSKRGRHQQCHPRPIGEVCKPCAARRSREYRLRRASQDVGG